MPERGCRTSSVLAAAARFAFRLCRAVQLPAPTLARGPSAPTHARSLMRGCRRLQRPARDAGRPGRTAPRDRRSRNSRGS